MTEEKDDKKSAAGIWYKHKAKKLKQMKR